MGVERIKKQVYHGEGKSGEPRDRAPVIALVTEDDDDVEPDLARDLIRVPACSELVSPLINVVPLQLFAYHVAVERGCDVDQPRNLAEVGDRGMSPRRRRPAARSRCPWSEHPVMRAPR